MGLQISTLISDDYRSMIEKVTKKQPWGGAVIGAVKHIHKYALDNNCKSILDYGSGKSDFLNTLNKEFPDNKFDVTQYEPARAEYSHDPQVCDMTVCVDVLEHVEPTKLDNVLQHINDRTNNIFYFKICLVPALSTFEDGSNLHLIIEDKEFWLNKLAKHWVVGDLHYTSAHIWGIAKKK